eukprot:CAMPEP_0113556984 /NCGR_PEP_ID=MMETSP0015_2-20120614/17547_1 /TAXON_ID=2838 /ORGANISM="Odontella" /LENGTH=273 /DNA_ID=CAMNT_0000458375 /DNA_START=134 /DNA_END=955 /DNA_ORIENTATION=- /assembly_acc=CAM_ASM_000160
MTDQQEQTPEAEASPSTRQDSSRSSLTRRSLTKRMFHPSTRDNSMHKWQTRAGIVGSLEVPSEPIFDYLGDLKPIQGIIQKSDDKEEAYISSFNRALVAWEDLDLNRSFVSACKSMPVSTTCCGLFSDEDKTMRDLVPYLNSTWSGHASERMESSGFAVDCFLWTWNNLQGKSETLVLLIRFLDLSMAGPPSNDVNGGGGAKKRRSHRNSGNSLRSSGRRSPKNASPKSILKEPTIAKGDDTSELVDGVIEGAAASMRSNVTAESSSGGIVVP